MLNWSGLALMLAAAVAADRLVSARGHVTLTLAVAVMVDRLARGHVTLTAQGALRGAAADDGSHVSYRGIPYAGSPVSTRFRKAPPASAWRGIREATQESVPCLAAFGGVALGDEDCLLLDVHAPPPPPPPAPRRPVLVWLLSGAAPAPPHLLTRRGLVLVVVNHRLGPLGFVCAGRDSLPGNAGAKDALLALRWVRDNIVAFGGDAARVTLAGHGRGAALAEALLLSPAAEGLLRGAILQSGSSLSPWAYNYDSTRRATSLAKHFTNGTDDGDIAKALLDARLDELVSKSRLIDFPYFPFGLCSEKQFKKEERLLDAPPIDILTKKRFKGVPILIGSSDREADALRPTLIRAKASERARRDFTLLLPEELLFVSESESKDVAERVRKEYFPERNFTMERLLEYCTDAYFRSHVWRSAALHAAAAGSGRSTYAYAAGADMLEYLSGTERPVDEGERELQELVVTLWTNFIEHGNPTPVSQTPPLRAWEAWRGVEAREYALGMAAGEVEEGARGERSRRRRELWEAVYDKYYYRRVRTSS